MKIVVRMTAKQVRKLIATSGAQVAFNKFRHDGTDYDAKRKSGKYPYEVVARQVAIEALAICDNPDWVKAVRAFAVEKALF